MNRGSRGCSLANRLLGTLLVPLVLTGLLGVMADVALAQVSNWSAAIQRTRVMLSLQPHATIPRDWQAALSQQLGSSSQAYLPINTQVTTVGELTWDEANSWLGSEGLAAEFDWSTMPLAWREQVDQVVFLTVAARDRGYVIRGRSLDLMTWQAGPLREQLAASAADVKWGVREVLRASLVPLVEIEAVDLEDQTARVRLRGDRLFREGATPPTLQKGDFLRAVVAVPDRQGKYDAAGTKVIPWTLLRVTQSHPDGSWTCDYESAYAVPLRARRSRRTRQLAYRVEAVGTETTLELRYAGARAAPRTGCQIYVQPWRRGGQAGATAAPLVYLGTTDWRGMLQVSRDQLTDVADRSAAQILAVKFGPRVIARLPIVVGMDPHARLELADDRPLVDVDIFLRAVEQDLLDLVARRQLLARRIRKLISGGDLAQASQVFGELRRLATQGDFLRRIETKQRELTLPSLNQRKKVDQAFADMRQMLPKLLSPTFVQSLQDEISAAQRTTAPTNP